MKKNNCLRRYGFITLFAGSLVASCNSPPPAPVVSQIMPSPLCALTDPRVFTIQGSGFLKNDVLPTVTFTNIANSAMTATVPATDIGGCDNQTCTTLTVSFPSTQLPVGSYTAAVTNNCQDATCVGAPSVPPVQADVVAPPTLTAVAPQLICQGQGMINLTGSNFYSGAIVNIGSASSMSVNVSSDGSTATANFSGMLPLSPVDQTTLATTPLDVTITNAAGCAATLASALTITPGPSVLFVDPPVIPANYSLQATVYATSVGGKVQSVSIAPNGSSNFTTLMNLVTDPIYPNRVLVPLPGNLAAGSYDLKLNDQTSCSALLPNAFKVVATSSLTVSTVTPSFGAFNANTAVAITGTGFTSTPRAYVAANGGGSGVNAAPLRAVTFVPGNSSLTAVVPGGLASGTYDLIVVNPNGSYGIKSMAFVVTANALPPPVITGISPSQVSENTNANITINGSNFRTGATLTPSCYDVNNGLLGGATATPTTVNASSIQATIKAPVGSAYCLMRVTDTDNNTFFDFSAIGITNAASNLTGFKSNAASNLGTARRAMAAAAGRPTPMARFIYAVGGDNGNDNAPIKTVEAASTGLDGTLGAFFPLTSQLPKALSFLGLVNVGRFLYAVGGFDGAAAVTNVYRAEILDPLNAPQFSTVDVRTDPTQGLMPGLYTYRISAVMGATDANNANGETLAGDFFPVQIPSISMGVLKLVLYWNQVPGAASYNIYRTAINGVAGTELLLANVKDNGMANATQSYIDDGTKAPTAPGPLPLGSTGLWEPMPALNTARAGAGVTAVPDPATAGVFYLYAMGGNSGSPATPTLLSTVEFLKITIANGGLNQTVGATWTNATNSLLTARWLTPGLSGTNAQDSVIAAPNSYIYSFSGISSNLSTATLDKPIYGAQVAAGGQPGAFTNTGSVGMNTAGYGAALVNNQAFGFGGSMAGTPTNNSVRAALASATSLGNPANLGNGSLGSARFLQGTALESAFIYQLGGVTTGGTVLKTTEQSIW